MLTSKALGEKMRNKVAIIMSCFNGEKYLRPQLESIRNQSFTDWSLYIRDDGSTDNTKSIINEYVDLDKRIKVLNDGQGNVGVKKSFFILLQNVNADFYMFSDQDDIWKNDKVAVTLNGIKDHDCLKPVLVHTNLTTIDENKVTINRLFYKNSKSMDKTNVLLSSNSVTGCTMMINRKLRDLVKSDDVKKMVMHDWWLALCASTTGGVYYINDSTMFYRQHNNNQVGTDTTFMQKITRLFSYEEEISRQKMAIEQASSCIEKHGDMMASDKREVLQKFVELPKNSFMKKLFVLKKYAFKKNSFLGTCSLLFIVIFVFRKVK